MPARIRRRGGPHAGAIDGVDDVISTRSRLARPDVQVPAQGAWQVCPSVGGPFGGRGDGSVLDCAMAFDNETDLTTLQTAAQAGDPSAATILAKRLLVGRDAPRDPNAAAQLLNAASQAGHGEAAAQIAVLIAASARNMQDWLTALDYLQQAAEQDWAPAQRQLMLLASDRASAAQAETGPPPEIWGVLRRSIRLEDWFSPLKLARTSDVPDIRMAEGFLSPAACDWMVARARDFADHARTYDLATGAAHVDPDRSNSAALFDIVQSDLVLLAIRARICAATGFYAHQLEETNVLHYSVGQRFLRHFDFLDPNVAGFAEEIARKGQRVATFLIYLNEGFEGAETDFPLLGQKFRPGKGGALQFSNVDATGVPDRKTLHAGLPPTAGEKWLLSQWIRAVPS